MENDSKNNKKSVVFGITKLDLGGAERVLIDICNYLCMLYDITIFTIYSGGSLEKELNKKIKIISLFEEKDNIIINKMIPIHLFLFGKNIYDKYIKNNRFDYEIAFLEGPITRLFRFKNNTNKIAWVHNDIQKVFGKGLKARIKMVIDKRIYQKYDLIVFVSKDNQRSFNKIYGYNNNEKVIYNYLDKSRVIKKANEQIDNEFFKRCIENKKCIILSVCRLTSQKGLDRLIRVHKRIINEGINHYIFIIGEGEEKKKLNKLIKELRIENTFILLGSKVNPYPYIKNSSIFGLFSHYEGYGMVIEEAKTLNKKIFITDTAAKEAVRDYSNAVISENNEEDIYRRLKNEIINFNPNIQ